MHNSTRTRARWQARKPAEFLTSIGTQALDRRPSLSEGTNAREANLLWARLGADTVNITSPVGDAFLGACSEGPHGGWSSKFPDPGSKKYLYADRHNIDPATYFRYLKDDYGNQVYVQLWETPGGWWARLGLEVSRLHDPSGLELCPVADVDIWVTAYVMFLMREGILTPRCKHTELIQEEPGLCSDPACFMAEVRVSRLDLAVDFFGLENHWVPRALLLGTPQRRLVRDSKRPYAHGAEAASGRTGGVRVKVYDRHFKKGGRSRRIAEGTIRTEVQARTSKLEQFGLRTLTRWDPSSCWRLFMHGFRWAGLDAEYGGAASVEARLSRLAPPTRMLCVDYLRDVAAQRMENWSRGRQVRAYAHIRALRIVPDLADDEQVGSKRRLDPHSAGERVPRVLRRPPPRQRIDVNGRERRASTGLPPRAARPALLVPRAPRRLEQQRRQAV